MKKRSQSPSARANGGNWGRFAVLGIDHEKLTVRHNGIDRRLTDVHGRVITDVLA